MSKRTQKPTAQAVKEGDRLPDERIIDEGNGGGNTSLPTSIKYFVVPIARRTRLGRFLQRIKILRTLMVRVVVDHESKELVSISF